MLSLQNRENFKSLKLLDLGSKALEILRLDSEFFKKSGS